MKLSLEQLNNIIYDLQGSCQSIDEVINYYTNFDFTSLDLDDLYYIDEHIFNCVTCGWWFEISEMSDSEDIETICKDCKDEER